MSKSTKDPQHFTLALTVPEILIKKINLNKNRSRSQSTIFAMAHSMAKVKNYKRLPHIFALALNVSEILNSNRI